MSSQSLSIWIFCPCYFDVDSFRRVREGIMATLSGRFGDGLRFVLVDDSAGRDPAIETLKELGNVRVVTPWYNLGPQEALVFALRKLRSDIRPSDYVVTLDSDGEDRPEDVPKLLDPLMASQNNLRKVVVARRTRRQEGFLFKICYNLFKPTFLLLAGTIIRNGTFAAYRGWLLAEVIYHPDFDQCYSSSFVSLPVELESIPIARGSRYGGKSKMGFTRLATHGFRMMMPFGEKIAIRGVFASAFGALVAVASCLAYLFFRPESLQFALAMLAASLIFFCILLCFSALTFIVFSQARSRSLRHLAGQE